MRIDNIKINQYGKLENKDFNLQKLNLIYGKNESGKSTLLNFIESMFYGASKNKNKKDFSDYELYKPWNGNEFSGNIDYTLDNGKKYYVFRNFEKKNPKIYDEQNNDVSENFKIDKKDGNLFFIEQTGITRDVLKSTLITEQNSVELDANTQNSLLQKIVNITETGEEETSYKKAKAKLVKMFLEEVGTERSTERPINKINENIKKFTQEINEIKKFEDEKYDIEERKNKIQKELDEEIENKQIYDKVKEAIENDKKARDEIKIKAKIIEENESKIKKLKESKSQLEKNKNKKLSFIILILLIILNIISLLKIRNLVLNILLVLLIPIYIIYLINKSRKNDTNIVDSRLKVLTENNEEIINDVRIMQEQLLEKNKKAKDELVEKYGNNVNELFNNEIYQISDDNKENINHLELELHKIELDKNNIEPQLNRLIEAEEELDINQRKLSELEYKKKIYELTSELMEESYEEMKSNIVPKFTKNLNENVKKFSNGNYSEVVVKDDILVKLNNGEYVPIKKLSLGTIEEIYLALRLSMINELSDEKMPIILDEAFAYFDDDRLSEILKFLAKVDNQVIMFSCTKREYELLTENGIEFNFINIEE